MTQVELQEAYNGMTFYMSISAIENKLKMPATTLQKAMKGERSLPVKWIKPVQHFFGIKQDEPVKAPNTTTTVGVIKEVARRMGKEAVPVTTKKTYTEYLRMSGDEIKANWDIIKTCKFSPGQISSLHAKKSK